MTKKILVVDDDASILDAVSLILEEAGYSVQTVFKGDETYKRIAAFRPHLILLDVLMSGNDGRHICRNLKADAHTRHIPIVMISAHPTAKEGALECGADDFLAKPFEIDDLLFIVEKHLNRSSSDVQ